VVLLTAATAAAAAEVADARVVFARYSSRPWATRTRVDRNRGVNTAQGGKGVEPETHLSGSWKGNFAEVLLTDWGRKSNPWGFAKSKKRLQSFKQKLTAGRIPG
jgi:hypothetical protein